MSGGSVPLWCVMYSTTFSRMAPVTPGIGTSAADVSAQSMSRVRSARQAKPVSREVLMRVEMKACFL